MPTRFRLSALGVCVALLCLFAAAPASADRGHARVRLPTHSSHSLAPTDGRGHDGAELEGIVTTVDASASPATIDLNDASRGPVVVTLQDTTIIRHGWTVMTADQILPGARIHVKAAPQDGGGFLAFVIFVQTNGTAGGGQGSTGTECDTEVQGTVSAIDCGSNTMTVTTDSGDVTVTFDSNSQFFSKGHTASTCDQIAVGDTVEVCGTQGDGSVLAAKVSFEAPDTCEDQASGSVSAIDCGSNTMTVTTDSGDVTVTFTDSTEFFGRKHTPATCADVAVGDAVEVEGTLQGDGSIVACKVSFEPTETEEVEVSGTITGTPDSGTQTFVLTTDQGTVTIDVNPDTVIQQHHVAKTFADLADGMNVEVSGQLQGDGTILAVKISIE